MARIHHLNCATLCPASPKLVGGEGSYFGRGKMICHCLLLETDKDGLILIDTGFGTADCADPGRFERGFRWIGAPRFDREETAIAQVEKLGFSAEDVRHIVVTHLDLDHAGGIPDFPDAQVHLHLLEHSAAMGRRTLMEKNRYIPAHWAHGPRWVTYEDCGDDFFGLVAVRKLTGIDADVALIPLFGHTRGHSGIAVRDGDHWLMHAGDAYFHHGELEQPHHCPGGLAFFQNLVAVDNAMRKHNQGLLRDLQARKRKDVTIFSAHDPVELDRLRARSNS